MRLLVSSLVSTSSLVLLAACGSHMNVVKKAAARDMSCPSKALEVEQLSKDKLGEVFLVTGCGRTATYEVPKKGPPVLASGVTEAPTPPTAALPPPPPPAPEERRGNWADTTLNVLNAVDRTANSVQVNGEPMGSQGRNDIGSSSSTKATFSATCCINGAFFSCPSVSAAERCTGNMGKSRPDTSSCSRDSSRDPTCK